MFPINIKLIVLDHVDKSVIGKGSVKVSSCHQAMFLSFRQIHVDINMQKVDMTSLFNIDCIPFIVLYSRPTY